MIPAQLVWDQQPHRQEGEGEGEGGAEDRQSNQVKSFSKIQSFSVLNFITKHFSSILKVLHIGY